MPPTLYAEGKLYQCSVQLVNKAQRPVLSCACMCRIRGCKKVGRYLERLIGLLIITS